MRSCLRCRVVDARKRRLKHEWKEPCKEWASPGDERAVKPVDPDRLLKDLGRRVAELRTDRSLTQERLAELAGISARYIQRVESGEENLTVRSLALLANVLRSSVIDFFEPPKSREVRTGRPAKKKATPE